MILATITENFVTLYKQSDLSKLPPQARVTSKHILLWMLIVMCSAMSVLAQSANEILSVPLGKPADVFSIRTLSPKVSADGRFTVFFSTSDDLAASDTNRAGDLFVRDRELGTTSIVNINHDGTSSGVSEFVQYGISPDGHYVVFTSTSGKIVTNDNNNSLDVFVRDIVAGTTMLVSYNSSGTSSGNSISFDPVITPDGRYVAFASNATNLIANGADNSRLSDIFVRDLQSNSTALVSINRNLIGSSNVSDAGSPKISDNGRYVAFNCTPDNINSAAGIFVHDLQTITTRLVSVSTTGVVANGGSYLRGLTPDGRYVAFESSANNLVTNDTNESYLQDVFVRDVINETTTLVSVSRNGSSSQGSSTFPAITPDGRYIAFQSGAPNLVANPPSSNSSSYNVFVRDLRSSTPAV